MIFQAFFALLTVLSAPGAASESNSHKFKNLRLLHSEDAPAVTLAAQPPAPASPRRFSTTLRYQAAVAPEAGPIPSGARRRPEGPPRRALAPPRTGGPLYPPAGLGADPLLGLYAGGGLLLVLGISVSALWAARRRKTRDAEALRLVAHELKSPLSAIESYLDLMAHEGPKGGSAELRGWLDDLRQVKTTAAHLRGTITDLLEMTQLEAGRVRLAIRPTDLSQLLRESYALYEPQAAAAGLTLDLVLPGSPAEAACDPDRLRQVVQNLLSNAIKFTPRGGQVKVALAAEGTGSVVLAVSDTGPGIAAADQKKLFGKFVRLKPGSGREGTGLGLYIAKTIVDAHGGRIRVESRSGGGTTFSVTIPRRTS